MTRRGPRASSEENQWPSWLKTSKRRTRSAPGQWPSSKKSLTCGAADGTGPGDIGNPGYHNLRNSVSRGSADCSVRLADCDERLERLVRFGRAAGGMRSHVRFARNERQGQALPDWPMMAL
jgi:hypothetical protein